jgi:TPR repeat protein
MPTIRTRRERGPLSHRSIPRAPRIGRGATFTIRKTMPRQIGNLYGMALGVPQDYAEALRWYRLAAAQGNAEAEDQIGFFYLSGWGVPQDSAQALKWFRKAADQGNEVAQRNIGMMFLQGMGVAADRAEAIRWFRLAAAKGDDDAKEALKYLDAQ